MNGTSQFGIPLADLSDAVRHIDRDRVQVIGLHFFPMSNVPDEDTLVDSMVDSIRTAGILRDRIGIEFREIDLGGGFAAPYGQPGDLPSYPRLRSLIEPALDDHLPGWRSSRPRIGYESGRYLVGQCGELALTVIDVKRSGDRTYVVLDGGINHLGGMSGLRRLLPGGIRPVVHRRPGEHADAGTRDEVATVYLVGPLCSPADTLGTGQLPSLRQGDRLVIPNVGAYGLTASLIGFLGHPMPAEITCRGDHAETVSRLVLKREPVWLPVATHVGSTT
jgi:diaminopimelate decarboxylase